MYHSEYLLNSDLLKILGHLKFLISFFYALPYMLKQFKSASKPLPPLLHAVNSD